MAYTQNNFDGNRISVLAKDALKAEEQNFVHLEGIYILVTQRENVVGTCLNRY